ncbi:MAG: hypothetical protein ACRD4Q_13405, partial [Candidatus Acidiferrales bacterium]
LTLQHEFPLDMVATASYVGALGRRQYIFNGAINMNLASPGPGSISPRRPYYAEFPNVAGISEAAPWYNTNYQALQTTLEHRFQKGLSLLMTYTWAHGLDDESTLRLDRQAEYGNSFLDVRQRFTLMASYMLPFKRNFLARNWGVNAIVVATTGIPFDITNAASRSNTGGGDRPNVVCDPTSGFSQSIYEWFNTSCFAAQPFYTYGDLGRNVLHAPGSAELDVALHREFVIKERMHLQLRGEAFNVTNTPAFSAPGGSFGSPSFGVISGAGLGRNIQLALRLTF